MLFGQANRAEDITMMHELGQLNKQYIHQGNVCQANQTEYLNTIDVAFLGLMKYLKKEWYL